jgi:hypothetical protein
MNQAQTSGLRLRLFGAAGIQPEFSRINEDYNVIKQADVHRTYRALLEASFRGKRGASAPLKRYRKYRAAFCIAFVRSQ